MKRSSLNCSDRHPARLPLNVQLKCTKLILTRQNGQQENIIRERDESITAQLVEDAVFVELQVQPLRHILNEEKTRGVKKIFITSVHCQAMRKFLQKRVER